MSVRPRMNVLHVIPGISPASGGPSKVIFEMCRALGEKGVAAEIATTDAGIAGYYAVVLGKAVSLNGVKTRCFRSELLLRHGFSIGLTRWLRKNIPRYDLVHIHSFFSYVTPLAAHYSWRAGVPFLVRPAGQLDAWSLKQRPRVKALFNRVLGMRLLHRAAAVHATSDMEYESVQRLGFGGKTSVVPLGINPPTAVARPCNTDECCRMIFLGRLHQKKGVALLLEAMQQLVAAGTAMRLSIVGSGDDEHVSELRRTVTRLGLGSRVTFMGFLEGTAKEQALFGADVFVLPSYEENFGLAVLEAMAAGVPVIVSDSVALAKEVSTHEAGRVVATGSVPSLAAALKEAAENPEAWRIMGDNAKDLVQKQFGWPRVVECLIDLYEKACSTR
jgi:glycosyltransferase involved in cell wall biosynthesis